MDKKKIRDWIIKNCRSGSGRDIDLSGLDFSEFDGDIWIDQMKVKCNLHQGHQTAGNSIHQDYQTATYIYQQDQTAKEMCLQDTRDMVKDADGYWHKRSLTDKVESLDIDPDLKKEIIEKIKEAGK